MKFLCIVILNAVHQVCGARVPDKDLLLQHSSLCLADQGHAISKAHVAEALLNSEHRNLHVDCTSRSSQRFFLSTDMPRNLTSVFSSIFGRLFLCHSKSFGVINTTHNRDVAKCIFIHVFKVEINLHNGSKVKAVLLYVLGRQVHTGQISFFANCGL